jgi:type II secretory ATPase GspE/PulE/Tfp pilus assembly ATPase PilB-like protein
MLAYLVQQAHKLNSSDIHIETQRGFIRIRFRMDGVLHPIARLSIEKYRVLVSAIASAANVSTASGEAQQGHISQHLTMADGNEVDINLRLETVPTVNGMDMVMRLFNMDQSMYNLDRLRLSEHERSIVDEIIQKPSGLVMVVGPTGSGKTTTLYSMLNTLNTLKTLSSTSSLGLRRYLLLVRGSRTAQILLIVFVLSYGSTRIL